MKYVVSVSLPLLLLSSNIFGGETWAVASQEEWTAATAKQSGLDIVEGAVSPAEKSGEFQSVVKRFEKKRSASSITFTQSPLWQNWNPIKNLGPSNLGDAPVLLTIGPDNYWMFGRYGGGRAPKFTPEDATLEGFDIPLKTTRFPNQYVASGGLKTGRGGYHAWQSRDMVNWVCHGQVTDKNSAWVTSAEHVDGTTYIYYDFPNDQDPHVFVDSDLTDGVPGERKGKVLEDPSHGSDSGFIRDLDGETWQKESEQFTRQLPETMATGILFRTIPYLNKTLYSAGVDTVTITPLKAETTAVRIYEPGANEITQLEVDPQNAQTIYARSLSKILVSKDGGTSWTVFLDNFKGGPLQAMALEARPPHRMAIGTNAGVFMATGPGEEFKPYTLAGKYVSALSFVRDDNRLAVAVGQQQSEIIRIHLDNQGQHKLAALKNIHVHHMCYDPMEANWLHLATQQGLYGSWNNLHNLFQRRYNNKFNTSTRGNLTTDRPGRVTYTLNRNPDDSLSLYRGDWGGVCKKITDSSFATSMPITGFLKLAGENHFLLCNKEGIFKSTDGAKNFRRVY